MESDQRHTPGSGAKTGMDDLKEEASHIAQRAKERGKKILSREKDDAAGTLDSVAGAFRSSADRLDDEQPRRYLGMAADRLESFGRQLRDKDIDSLLGEAQDTARRAPVAFFAGSVITGFLLARFMKSSAERSGEARGTSGPGPDGASDRAERSFGRDAMKADPPFGSTAQTNPTERQGGVSESAPQSFGGPISSTIGSSGGSHA